MLTFLAYAKGRRIAVKRYESTAEGRLAKDEAGMIRFVEILIRPRICLAAGADLEAARRIVAQLPARCFIGASVKAEPKIEAEILVETLSEAPYCLQ
jgi:hypothetical protein